jgi:hypothetical protein
MVHVFIDTNIFLHFISLTEIDWKEIISDKQFKIVVPLTVISELDNKKKHPSKKIADKAKSTLEKFYKVMEGVSIGNFDIILLSTRPGNEVFEAHNLFSSEPDDRILASIISYETTERKMLISDDLAIRLRAKQLGLESDTVPSKYSSNELTDEEKQIKALTDKLDKAISNAPKLRLTFVDGSHIVRLENREIDNSVTLEKFLETNDKKVAFIRSDGLLSDRYGAEDIRAYNASLLEYNVDYQSFLEDSYYHSLYIFKTFELCLTLDNIEGSVPAKKIEVELNFPDDVKVSIEKFATPQEPNVPNWPVLSMRFSSLRKSYKKLNYSNGMFDSHKSRSLHFNEEELKHHKSIQLEKFYITFTTSIHSFTIDYTILADNMGKKLEGKLSVIIE